MTKHISEVHTIKKRRDAQTLLLSTSISPTGPSTGFARVFVHVERAHAREYARRRAYMCAHVHLSGDARGGSRTELFERTSAGNDEESERQREDDAPVPL